MIYRQTYVLQITFSSLKKQNPCLIKALQKKHELLDCHRFDKLKTSGLFIKLDCMYFGKCLYYIYQTKLIEPCKVFKLFKTCTLIIYAHV